MSLAKLSISYKCLSAIGNHLDLKEMMEEFLKTFIQQTDAVSGMFLVNRRRSHNCEELVSLGKKEFIDVNEVKEKLLHNELLVDEIDKNFSYLAKKIDKGCFIFVYSNKLDLSFVSSVLDSLRNKIEINKHNIT